MSEFKRSLKSSSGRMAAGVFGQVINMLGQIAVVPLFLHYWTKREYGEWLILTAVPNLLWSIEGGLAGLATNRMVLNSAIGDWKSANRLFQNILFIQLIVSVVLIMMGAFFVRFVDFRHFFGITEMTDGDAGFVLILMLGYMLLGWCISLLRAPYFAAQKSVRGYMVSNFWRLSDFAVICMVLLFHGHASMVAQGEVMVAAGWIALALIDIRANCPEFELHFKDLSWQASKSVFRDGLPLFLGQAGNAIFLQGYPLVIARTLGPLSVVNFTTIRTVTRVFLQGILVVTSASSIELTNSYATQKWDLYLRWLKILTAFILLGSVGACLGLFFAGTKIISLWTQGKVLISSPLLLLFGLSVSLQAMWSLYYNLLYTANKHHLQCCLFFAITVAALAVGSFTIGRFGFTSVPVIMIVADLAILLMTITLCVRFLPEVPLKKVLVIFRPAFYREKAELYWKKTNSHALPPF